ncbi:MAG: chemotaxis-specific protein-glutamate methyltransferase CheB, partial [Planctomycetota bacterium]
MEPAKKPIRVLVVDDSAFMRRALSGIIQSDAGLELIGTAFNGKNALEKIDRLEPDVVTLDIEMPELDGISTLKKLMKTREHPPAVLMCSSLTTQGSEKALEALQHGAADVIAKPTTATGLHESPDAKQMLAKIRGLAQHRSRFNRFARSNAERSRTKTTATPADRKPASTPSTLKLTPPACVVIGSSTGGPPALEALLAELTPELAFPVIIAQHMPPMFTQSLATRLDAQSPLSVVHAETGMPLVAGKAYVAQGGRHIRVARVGTGRTRLEITAQPTEALYKPSVNVLFETASRVFGDRALGVMLTGMGDDG